MRAIVVEEPGRFGVTTVADPVAGRGEVVVVVGGSGICGTDLHILEHGLPTARYPLVPGHEPWGRVAEIGADVSVDLAVGDLVAIDPSLHCGLCDRCRAGQGNLCLRWGAVGATQAGAWADLVAVPQRTLHRLPADFPMACASLIEPVACAIRGLELLDPGPDRPAIVMGAGTMGILLALLLDVRGIGPVTLVEQNERRRAIASRVTGASVVAPDELGDAEAMYVIDATGNPAAIEDGIERVAPGGTFMVFGVAGPDQRVRVSPFRIYQREIRIIGSMAIRHTFGPAIETVARHAVAFAPLATHTFSLEELPAALDVLRSGEGVKVTLAPSGGRAT
jgi:2-desacetyl-2-hydroxyethyl bacteriochlorophyllide A dehydrogenase